MLKRAVLTFHRCSQSSDESRLVPGSTALSLAAGNSNSHSASREIFVDEAGNGGFALARLLMRMFTKTPYCVTESVAPRLQASANKQDARNLAIPGVLFKMK